MSKSKYNWLLYVDADEAITDELKLEIGEVVTQNVPGVYQVKRRNFFLGKEMYQDKVERLFHKSLLQTWEGEVHEHPVLDNEAEIKTLANPLLHYTHRSITSMLEKTNEWSEIEAQLRIKAKHPPIAWWRLIRIAITTFMGEFFGKKLYRYGREGLFEATFQMIDKIIVFVKLWERQNATDSVKTN